MLIKIYSSVTNYIALKLKEILIIVILLTSIVNGQIYIYIYIYIYISLLINLYPIVLFKGLSSIMNLYFIYNVNVSIALS